MKKKVIFYAPLGRNTPPEKIGGAEVGCQKTMQIYKDSGIDVLVLDKPATSKGKVHFLLGMLLVPLKFILLLKKEGRQVPVHIVGFYNKIAKFEWFLMKIAHWCGNKVIYELRNGSMILTYQKGSEQYRATLKDLLLEPEIVLCQGLEYVEFIKKEWGVDRSFYPNYIMNDFVKPNNLNRSKPLRFVYFGRVTEAKNVDVIIEVLAIVRRHGIEASLDIIGGCNEDYLVKLKNIAEEHEITPFIYYHGRQSFDYIAQILFKAHYFLFPSTEKQEGHSNSLTEAMGCGVVPIASTAGFNKSICGNKLLIVDEISADSFAQRIIDIEQDGLWPSLSTHCYERIMKYYTQKIVSEKFVKTIETLYNA